MLGELSFAPTGMTVALGVDSGFRADPLQPCKLLKTFPDADLLLSTAEGEHTVESECMSFVLIAMGSAHGRVSIDDSRIFNASTSSRIPVIELATRSIRSG